MIPEIFFKDFFLEGEENKKIIKYKNSIVSAIGAEYYVFQDSKDRFYINLTHLIPNYWIAELEIFNEDPSIRNIYKVSTGKEENRDKVIKEINNILSLLLKEK